MADALVLFTRPNGIVTVGKSVHDLDVLLKDIPRKVLKKKTLTKGVSAPLVVDAGELIDPVLADINKVSTEEIPYEVVTEDQIPTDYSYRDLWRHDTSDSPQKIGMYAIDAVSVSLSRVRANRDTALKELDVEYTIARRTGGDTSELDARRLALLDATNSLKALDLNGDGLISVDEASRVILTEEQKSLAKI